MNKTTLECSVKVFKSETIEKVEIPKTLTIAEVLNYLEFSKKLQFPKKSFIMVKKADNFYTIPDESQYISSLKQNSPFLIVYPPTIFLHVHCPDKRINIRSYDSRTPTANIVEELCNNIFKLDSPESYGLFIGPTPLSGSFPTNSSLIEIIPDVENVWLFRRFWFRSLTNFTKETDIHFCYAQAKLELYESKFPYQQVDYIALLALSLIVEFDGKTKEAIKFISKANKKELRKYLPKYASEEKKVVKSVLDAMPSYPDDVLEAKKLFLEKIMKFDFFGVAIFKANFDYEGKNYNGRIAFPEDGVCFLESAESFEIVRKCDYLKIKKYKACSNNVIRLNVIEDGVENIVEYQSDAFSQTLDHFIILLNYLKQANLKKREAEKQKRHHLKRRSTLRTSSSSFTDLLSSNSDLKNRSSALDPNSTPMQSVIFDRIDQPKSQEFLSLDIPRSSRSVLCSEYNNNEQRNTLPTFSQNLDYGISKNICNLLKNTISRECVSPLAEAETLVYSLGGSKKAIAVLKDCSGGFNQTVATIATVGIILADEILVPLDAASCINYIHSIMQRYIYTQLDKFNFIGEAHNVSQIFARVAIALYNRTEKMNLPLSYVLVGAYKDEFASEIHDLIDASCASILFCAISVARAFVKSGMITEALIDLLESMPRSIIFDPIYATNLCNELSSLADNLKVTERAKAFMMQDYKADIDVHVVRSIIERLKQFLKFIKSPASLYLLTNSQRCFTKFAFPTSNDEAIKIYTGAMESAYVYWNGNDGKNAELSLRIQSNAKSFFSLFMANAPNVMIEEVLNNINMLMQRGYSDKVLLEEFLDSSDPLHTIVIKILSNGDIEEAIPLLAIDSLSLEHKRSVFYNSYKTLDRCLRSTAVKPSSIDVRCISSSFSLLSTTTISISRENEKINSIKEMIGEIGYSLINVINESPEERLVSIPDVRTMLRKLVFIVNDTENGYQRVEKGTEKFEMSFLLERPNLEDQISSLRQICTQLSIFSLKRGK